MSSHSPAESYHLSCPECDLHEHCDADAMLGRLQAVGMLRRSADADPELIAQLLPTASKKLRCPECDAALVIESLDDAQAPWPAEQPCEGCGQTIPAARLEAIPNATMCAVCQAKVDRGEPVGEAEYCSYCGGIMVLRKAASGVTRYVQRCGDCGR